MRCSYRLWALLLDWAGCWRWLLGSAAMVSASLFLPRLVSSRGTERVAPRTHAVVGLEVDLEL